MLAQTSPEEMCIRDSTEPCQQGGYRLRPRLSCAFSFSRNRLLSGCRAGFCNLDNNKEYEL